MGVHCRSTLARFWSTMLSGHDGATRTCTHGLESQILMVSPIATSRNLDTSPTPHQTPGARSSVNISILVVLLALVGCAATEERPPRPVDRCDNPEWVEGHSSKEGNWHRGHWRCPSDE